MPGVAVIRAFLDQATTKETRATVLKPLAWMMLILVAAILSSLHLEGPHWLTIMFAMFACMTILLYLVAYIYCLFTDKDALRSETYSIQKLAIEKGFVGDDISGRLKPTQPILSLIDSKASDESEVKDG